MAGFVLGVLLDPEDGGITFLQNTADFCQTTLHSRRYTKIN
jgi:hypothetical protein